MIDFLRAQFGLRFPYRSEIARQRAVSLLVLTYGAIVVVLATLGVMIGVQRADDPLIIVLGAATLIVAGLVVFLIQRGLLTAAIWLFIVATLALLAPWTTQGGLNLNFALVTVPVIAAGVLLGRRGFIVIALLSIGVLALRFFGQTALDASVRISPAELLQTNLLPVAAAFGFGAVLLFLFSGSAERIARSSVADLNHLVTINRYVTDTTIHAGIAGREGEDLTVAQNALHLLETDLGYTQAQIYQISAGTINRRIRSGGIAESGSFVLTDNEARFIRDTAALQGPGPLRVIATDSLESSRYLTPPARIAALFPLRLEGRTIGVLDVQAADIGAFTPNRVRALVALADGLAVTTNYSQNINGLQNTIADQQRILGRVRAQLTEAQQRSGRMVTEGWQSYLDNRAGATAGMGRGIGYDIGLPDDALSARSAQPIPASDLPEEILDALRRGEVLVDQAPTEQIIKAPILLRDQVLGAMSFRIPIDRPVTDRQVEMVRTVANRLAAALENNRLFEQSQGQAQRERKANEIAGELLTATNVEALMSLAAERFNEALGAVYTRISLQPGALAEPPLAGGSAASNNGNGHHADLG